MAGATRSFKIDGCAAKFDVAVIRRELNALHDAADGNFQREIVRFISAWQRFSFVIFSFYYNFSVNGIRYLIYFMNIYLSGFPSCPLVTKKFFHLPLDDVGYDPIL